ncbi:ABC transporter permease [Aneurinibacillus aneurinilyticus]|jgi:putative spermidine/putrescine transport system permease protein|uniref:ABC transporter permease n=2 Tax=Aneurinibacillus aneurinilyticus TaxID=1391 RepID=A0A848CR32_ANEAE|nr:ABC transporter permease [Aneurinibacillus aneurinilyticus]ERI05575.1 ABC transporter, permease protein [Aneurinibacillus aneurinilyticus ATCC 12856]MCI1693675.1 ABC transporter permease [Aneurinibacillus aneurinilyticus]MED0671033.1 ABC transporter permease [Aneurinibacillus aneurinilyticus]MED0709306.1 ABC transporter permease [Aneurinibacillus aneurinilyticus]MED0724367.1 ABC transporter permease [Aneurinibacillus aneurinilyticus]
MESVRHYAHQEVTQESPLNPKQETEPEKGSQRKKKKTYVPGLLLLLPILLFIFGFFVVPMLYILYLSFIYTDSPTATNAVFSLKNYMLFFSDSYYLSSLWITVKVSLYTVLVSLLLGYPVALTMAKSSPRVRGYIALLIAAPLLVSIVVRNFGWYLLLLPNGTINSVLASLGIIDSPLKLLFSEIGVIIGLSNAYLPFMILAIATSLYNIDPSLERASAILGASPLRSFFSVTLPLSLPGIVSGCVLVFSMSMSAYVTPALMGGANVPMMPVVAYDQINNLLRWTFGSALSYVLLATTMIMVTVFTRGFEKSKFREVFR